MTICQSVDPSISATYIIDEAVDKKASYTSALWQILALRLFLHLSVCLSVCVCLTKYESVKQKS